MAPEVLIGVDLCVKTHAGPHGGPFALFFGLFLVAPSGVRCEELQRHHPLTCGRPCLPFSEHSAWHCNFKVGVFDRKVLSCRYSHGGLPRPPSMTAQATALRPRQTQGDLVFVDTMIKREAIPREFTPHLISPSARAACARGGRVAPISSRVPITPHFEGVYRYTIERFAPREGGVIRHRPSRDPRDVLMVRGLYTAPNRATSSCESLHFARRAQCDMPPWVA